MKQMITLIIALAALAATAQPETTPAAATAKGLILHWSFDEPVDTVVKDSSGNNVNGKVHPGSPDLLKSIPGKVGNAFFFDGKRDAGKEGLVNPQITTNKFWKPELLEGMTIEFWMQLGPNSDWQKGLMYIAVCAPGNYGPPFVLEYLWNSIVMIYNI